MTRANDVLVLGGGVIGLAIALELALQGVSVTLITRNENEAASYAAAGMLAPQAERLLPGAMLDLCLSSRKLYPDWIRKLENLAGLDAGYWACGILSPVYEADVDEEIRDSSSAHAFPTPHAPECRQWLNRSTIHKRLPGLSPDVIGGWWYPEDGQVDNRALTRALWVAVQAVGVQVFAGVTVQAIATQQQRVISVETTGERFQAEHYVLATGAWSQNLLPISVYPKKGQMLSVQIPVDTRCQNISIHAGSSHHDDVSAQEKVSHRQVSTTLPLQTVLFGKEIYIVPRRDGRVVIGATNESVGFTAGNTPVGVQALLNRAIQLFPVLQDFPLQELWWGFRPATPDELPILGTSPYSNLTLATGHYRNGILLTPVTADLIASLVLHQQADPQLAHFHWSRFS